MKSNLGQTLRSIRKGKQMTLEELADKHLSASQISRFERGESEISAARLINILDKLNISMEEFLIVHNQDSNHVENFSSLIRYIGKELLDKNIENIKKLLNSKQFHLLPFEVTMVKSIISSFDKSYFPSEDEVSSLTDYLFKIDNWGYYEITLLGNCARTINYSSLFLLTKEMIRNYIYSSLNKTNKKLVTQLAINCLFISLELNEMDNCHFLISEIESLLDKELNYFEKTVFSYATGYFEHKNGNIDGIKQMKQAIHIFEFLNEEYFASNYREHYQKHIGDLNKD